MSTEGDEACGTSECTGGVAGLTEESQPKVANLHVLRTRGRTIVLSVPSGRVYDVGAPFDSLIRKAVGFGDADRAQVFAEAAGIETSATAVAGAPTAVPVRALSLAIAQRCNLGCTYCYAQQGTFGSSGTAMTEDVAKRAVDLLLEGVPAGETASLAFMGGEPLLNRRGIGAVVKHAEAVADGNGVRMSYALTTNGTLVTEEDARFLDEYGFTVTFSLDGVGALHDRLRPSRSGAGSYDRAIRGVRAVVGLRERRCRVVARVSVTPENLELPQTFLALNELGFDGILFAPVVHAPSGMSQMEGPGFERLLGQMIECGDIFWSALRRDCLLPYSNVIETIRRLHYYRRDAYPCGAGGAYLGVSAGGGLYACHRFVDDAAGELGHVDNGVDERRQRAWLESRHVEVQSPCGECWARYLCGGGCHYEAVHEGRVACDYIRGWLHYCLRNYSRLLLEDRVALRRILRGGA